MVVPLSFGCLANLSAINRASFMNPARSPLKFPIAERAARSGPCPAVSSLQIFVRRPPEFAARLGGGRHPKTFTQAVISGHCHTSLDDLVGSNLKREGHLQAERLGSEQIDHKLELGCLDAARAL
jgi:hypothetical protein